ncbi:hypothetical protein A4A49_04849 [Nicotiana attenuata]|uniref:Uncharacterized protein n=1 Tax=Nicotiana attenuata TaxID=49451 RepID=A0A1J6IU46_NICAT|nr:hypothetical protein A4A49_04849 [Nicotiana attenuata]
MQIGANMASAKELINFGFLLTILLQTTTVGILLFPSIQVMALREMPPTIALAKRELLPLTGIIDCGNYCRSNSDCSTAYLCKTCRQVIQYPNTVTYACAV